MVAVRAVYQQGQLKLLDPVDLTDGEEVAVQIVSSQDILNNVLADLIVKSDSSAEAVNEHLLQQQLDESTQGVTLSDVVIDERQNGR